MVKIIAKCQEPFYRFAILDDVETPWWESLGIYLEVFMRLTHVSEEKESPQIS